jgi:hypothetical protein
MKTYNHIKIGVLISVLFSLFCFSCNNFFQPSKPEKSTEGKGYVSLSIGGVQVGRTILPQATATDFQVYKLVFVNSHTNEELSLTRTNDNLAVSIPLNAGTYHLTVTAYRDSAPNKPAAEGYREGIKISPNMETLIQLPLKVIIEEEGEGTFRWNITYAEGITVEKAEMIITRFTKDGEVPAYNNNTIAQQSSIELDAGYYRVVIKLSKPGGKETAELREILHIYPNMESVFNPVITSSHFTSLIYVTNGLDSGDGSLRWAIEQAIERENSTIIIDSSVKTITLTSTLQIAPSDPDSPISLTIEGNGVTITQDSPSEFRLLFVSEAHIITIRRVHFKGGKSLSDGAGGAIYNKAILTLESCIFSENQVDVSGGAINNCGTMVINGCTFYGNSAANSYGGSYGGAIYNYESSLSLTGNLFYGNTASSYTVVYNGTSGGYNVVDVPLGEESNQSGWTSGTDDQYIPGPTVMQKTFKPFTGSKAVGVLTNLPADYPTIDFYGYPITPDAAAGAVQEIETNICTVTFDTGDTGINIGFVVVEQGEKIEKTDDSVWSGYTFEGWYENQTYEGNPWNFDSDTTPYKSTFTLYAKLEPKVLINGTLADKLGWLTTPGNARNGGEYTIVLEDDISITPQELNFDVPVTIILKSKDANAIKTISLSSTGSMFTIGAKVTLILENITLEGPSGDNTAALVKVVIGGKLIMENGSTITGNTNSGDGGGVYVDSNSTFIMNGGTISGNSTGAGGGGVYVGGGYPSGGTFIMNGGTISGNTANAQGGGVYAGYSSTFTMTNGIVYGNEASTPLNNTSSSGAALFTYSATAKYGTTDNWKDFSLTSTSNPSDKYIDATIRIVNGELAASTASEWATAISQIKSGGEYVINVVDSFAVAGTTTSTFGSVEDITVTITGVSTTGDPADIPSISLEDESSNNGSLLIIGGKQIVTIENIDLLGKGITASNTTNTDSLVKIDGGTLNMYGGKISGNKITRTSSVSGGGVYVVNSGKFNMQNATISDNEINITTGFGYSGAGGGVYVHSSEFTMNDGTISGNKINAFSSSTGGGVYVYNGKFTMQDATISDNEINITNSSEGGSGGGVYLVGAGSKSEFNMTNGIISGNIINSTGSTGSGSGGGVSVSSNTTFNMTFGTIDNNIINIKNNGNGCGGGVDVSSSPSIFIMDQANISDNTINITGDGNGYGGGVYMNYNSKFTMNSGTIDHNEIIMTGSGNVFGGGVYVKGSYTPPSSSFFNMKGGEIKRNSVSGDGGGVYVDTYSKFQIETGTVYGNDIGENYNNTATTGAALYVVYEVTDGSTPGTAEYGTFTDGAFDSLDDLLELPASFTNDTIKFEGGVPSD